MWCGTAHHISEKYLQLARDAQASGDPVMAESYLSMPNIISGDRRGSAGPATRTGRYQRPPGEALVEGRGRSDFGIPDRLLSPERFPPLCQLWRSRSPVPRSRVRPPCHNNGEDRLATGGLPGPSVAASGGALSRTGITGSRSQAIRALSGTWPIKTAMAVAVMRTTRQPRTGSPRLSQ